MAEEVKKDDTVVEEASKEEAAPAEESEREGVFASMTVLSALLSRISNAVKDGSVSVVEGEIQQASSSSSWFSMMSSS